MMRILIDTNILISAALSIKGHHLQPFKKAVTIIAKAMSLES